MTGSLQIKNDKYYVVINFYEYGKRKQKWISTDLPSKNNKKKAEQALREILYKFECDTLRPRTDVLFSEYVKNWLEHKKESVDEVTYQGYELLAESHIIPYFEEHQIKLQKLDVEDLQKYFDHKKRYGRLDGSGGLSARSLRLHRNIIHQTLNLAIKNKVIQNNPCELVDLPKNERFNSSFYTVDQIHTLFNADENDELFYLIKNNDLYGLRRSEV
ncbi:MAG: tyrosine-type recombinase/integrase family protein, partial [Oscillospiraceae bacterium]|nr:tyrosine-type recombinase/integrase family protein [Oscillospiraceae bacterium]